MSGFPASRLRRLRASAPLRRMVEETRLAPDQLVMPLFVVPGEKVRQEIASMPGNFRLSVDELVAEGQRLRDLGVPAVILFGIPESKDPVGTGAYADDGIVQRGLRALKRACPDLVLMADICLCEYTSHGHCGVLEGGRVKNDETLALLARTAVSQARAGADLVAPSDMMDGRVGAIRRALDEAGFPELPIMAYSAKYASSYYGPFRDAADSAPASGDRRGYQMAPPNVREAMREIALDVEEGADIVMVKPTLAYLDILARARQSFDLPLAAYNVSGEFAMIKAAGRAGWIDERRVTWETLIAIRRAGADIILTYFAADVARWFAEGTVPAF